jgi:hypothetical protein
MPNLKEIHSVVSEVKYADRRKDKRTYRTQPHLYAIWLESHLTSYAVTMGILSFETKWLEREASHLSSSDVNVKNSSVPHVSMT